MHQVMGRCISVVSQRVQNWSQYTSQVFVIFTSIVHRLRIRFFRLRYEQGPYALMHPILWLQDYVASPHTSFADERMFRKSKETRWKCLVDWFWLTILPLVSSLLLVGCQIAPFALEVVLVFGSLVGITWWLTLIARKLFEYAFGPGSRYSNTPTFSEDISWIIFFGYQGGCLAGLSIIFSVVIFFLASVLDWFSWLVDATPSSCMQEFLFWVKCLLSLRALPAQLRLFIQDISHLHRDLDNEFRLREDINRLLGADTDGVWDWITLTAPEDGLQEPARIGPPSNPLPTVSTHMVDPFPLEGSHGILAIDSPESRKYYEMLCAPGTCGDFDVDVRFDMIWPGWKYRHWLRRRWLANSQTFDTLKNVLSLLHQPTAAPPPDHDVISSSLTSFLQHFNPAVAGMALLFSERMDRLVLRSKLHRHRVSVDLQRCRSSILRYVAADCTNLFPAAIETVLNTFGPSSSPLIVDSGASCCISPHKEDFISYAPSTVKIKDLSGSNSVAGCGLVKWTVLDQYGRPHNIEILAYHVPKASVRLISPQCVYQTKGLGGNGIQNEHSYTMVLDSGASFAASYGRANLPILPLESLQTNYTCFWTQCFGVAATEEHDWSVHIFNASKQNKNLTLPQKELLLWHQRLSHVNLFTVHNLLRLKRSPKVTAIDDFKPIRDKPTLPCSAKIPSSACHHLLCAACEISKATRRRPSNYPAYNAPVKEMSLKEGHIQPGLCVSCDHYLSPTPGRSISSSGYSSTRHGYNGGTIFVDHCSGKVFHHPQRTITASDTIRGKLLFEREAADVGVSIKSYHSDNGVFNSEEFKSHCSEQNQKLTFSGVGAHHQNGVAERSIQTISNMARANMIHANIMWPDKAFTDLWPQAMSYAIWIHNQIPPGGYGFTPDEIWSGIKNPVSNLQRAHVFGCPVYVLDPKLQDGKKIPKWDARARQGIFVGFPPVHSSLVPLILNPRTQHISPQYHVIFDDKFTTVPALSSEQERNETFARLFESSRDQSSDNSVVGRSRRGAV